MLRYLTTVRTRGRSRTSRPCRQQQLAGPAGYQLKPLQARVLYYFVLYLLTFLIASRGVYNFAMFCFFLIDLFFYHALIF